jgi:hypothetical protein
MSKSLLNLLVQIGPGSGFGPAVWALAFSRPALPPPDDSLWALASRLTRPSPSHPSPSLMCGSHPYVFLLWPLGHEAATTGRPSTAGSPFGCPTELLPLPVIDAPIPLHRPAHELPPPPCKSHREHPRRAPPLLTPSFAPLFARVSLSPAHRLPPPSPSSHRCLPSPSEPGTWIPMLPSSSSAPHPATSTTGGAEGQAPMSSGSWQWLPVHDGPGRRGPQPHGLSPQIFPSKINSRKSNFPIFLEKILENPLGIQTFITFQPQLQIQ